MIADHQKKPSVKVALARVVRVVAAAAVGGGVAAAVAAAAAAVGRVEVDVGVWGWLPGHKNDTGAEALASRDAAAFRFRLPNR